VDGNTREYQAQPLASNAEDLVSDSLSERFNQLGPKMIKVYWLYLNRHLGEIIEFKDFFGENLAGDYFFLFHGCLLTAMASAI
jgi:hypothetical protein